MIEVLEHLKSRTEKTGAVSVLGYRRPSDDRAHWAIYIDEVAKISGLDMLKMIEQVSGEANKPRIR